MIELLITLVPSVVWLIYRCIRLFQIPVEEIVLDLNITVPHIPKICIDAVTKSSVLVHWDINVAPEEHLFYILMVNGKEVETISSRSCEFCDLTEDTLYQIQIAAVDSVSQYRSQSKPVHIRTLLSDDKQIKVIEQVQETKAKEPSSAAKPPTTLTKKIIENIDDMDKLNQYLNFFHSESWKLNFAFKKAKQLGDEQFKKLQEDNETLTKNSADKSSSTSKISAELKEYTRKKEDTLLLKARAQSQLLETKKNYDAHSKNLATLKDNLERLKQKKAFISENGSNEISKIQQQISSTNEEIEQEKHNLHNKEEQVKQLKLQKKLAQKLHDEIERLGVDFNESAFNKDFSLNDKGIQILKTVLDLQPNWENDLTSKVKLLHEFCDVWKLQCRDAIKDYTAIHNDVESKLLTIEPRYSASWMTDSNAAQKFGCSNFVSSKSKRGRSKSVNNNSNKNLVMTNASSSSSSSNSPGPIASISSPSSGMGNTFNHYSDIYSNDERISSPTLHTLDSPPIHPSLNVNDTITTTSPTVVNSSLMQPSLSVPNWSSGLNRLLSPSLQGPMVQQPLAQPPSQPQDDLLQRFNQQNLSSSSLNSSRYNIWNGSNPNGLNTSLSHGRSISGGNIWQANPIANPTDINFLDPMPTSSPLYFTPLGMNNVLGGLVANSPPNSLNGASFLGMNFSNSQFMNYLNPEDERRNQNHPSTN